MMVPPDDHTQSYLNPADFTLIQNRFGQSAYRSAFNTVPHECSSTIDERDMVLLSAPAPAPMHHRVSSVELGEYGYPSKSARRLTRLYKSVDTMELEPETNVKSNENFFVVPTNCSIRQNPDVKELYHAQSTNASSTIRKFHGDHTRMAHYSEVGLDSTGRPHVSLSLSEEYEQLKADYQASIEKLNQTMNSIRTFWSPELKKERQMRREVERLLQTPGTSPGTVQETGHPGLTDMRIRELENTIIQLQEMLKISEQQILDPTGRIAFENALRVVDEKQAQINELQDELSTLRINRTSQPRDFTDKTITNHEMITLRMKMERSEMELSEKKTELAQSQARMRAAEEQVADLRQHVHLLKEQITNREQQHTLLQGDVDALRQKLEGKNQQMEHRDRRIERLENELSDVKGELSEKNEQLQQSCHRISQMMGRIDGLETSLREKEVELDNAKIRLSSHPDVIKENDLKEKLESITIEKKRLQEQMDQLRRNTEKERIEQQETYQVELQQLRCNIESLQKELSDRDVFLESQNEKIGDMDRELTGAQQCLQAVMGNKGKDELRREVESARNEVEKLLKMVRQLEKENTHLSLQCKQLQSTIDRGNGDGGSSSTLTKDCIHGEVPSLLPGSLSGAISAQAKRRIEELEEALRESVSITAEREVHLSQQKHLLHQVNQQLNDARRENAELRRRVTDCWSDDHEHLMKALELERQQHIEQLSQLKKEALLVAVAEKDEHIDYLEKSRAPREEIEIIRRHKDALLRKLKQENEHRSVVVRSEATNNVVQTGPPAITVGNPASFVSQSAHQDIATADMDDSEGIWA